ncbi:MAG TPA: hypothetical protein VEC17_01855 [Candidatus Binatia bacterium]|nr:hypothetical protein [Candidatus Binatia bacterium]
MLKYQKTTIISVLAIITLIASGLWYWQSNRNEEAIPTTVNESDAAREIRRYASLHLSALDDVSPYFDLALRAGDIWYEQQSIDIPKETISLYNRDGSINKDLRLDEIPNTLKLKTFVFTSPEDASIKWILYVFEDQLGKPYISSHRYTRLSIEEWHRTRRIEEIASVVFDKTGASLNRSKIDVEDSTPDMSYEESRLKLVEEAVRKYQSENREQAKTLLKAYSGLPTPKDDERTIQVYSKIIESHSGNSELYYLTTYSKLIEEINDYAGELGTKEVQLYECKKNTRKCLASSIVERAKEAKLEGYPHIGYCFTAWDAEKERMFTRGCGTAWAYEFTQFNYGVAKPYQFGGDEDPLEFLAINKPLTYFAMERRTSSGPNYLNHPTAILIYSTENPENVKTIDLTRYINTNGYGTMRSEFVWDSSPDGKDVTAHLALDGNIYRIDAQTGEISPR